MPRQEPEEKLSGKPTTNKPNKSAAKQPANSKSQPSKEQAPEVAASPTPPYIAHRGRQGLKLLSSFSGEKTCQEEIILAKTEDKNERIESACCSEDGQLLAWCDNNVIKCVRFEDQAVVFEQPNTTRSNRVMISPKSTKIVTYNTMSGGDNLHFWDIATGSHLKSMPFNKATRWKPIFSMNEEICAQHINSEVLIYGSNKFEKPKQRLSNIRVDDFSLSTASFEPSQTYQHIYEKRIKNKHHHMAIYTAGTKAQPSIVKIIKYPNLGETVTQKSFFKADSVKFSWSPSGHSLLLTCQTDFDKTGKSYYGEQSLNFLNIKGESYFVKLPKEGTVSCIEWFPSCDQDMFVCIYGSTPAKVSLFNNKCEVLHEFGGSGNHAFNGALFNPFGTLLAISGFGNLAGQLCIWNFEKKKLIYSWKVPETTDIGWCADGQHILTCTTSPRLRVSNGFRIWHYTGSLLHEDVGSNDPNKNIEIYDVLWQPRPGGYVKPKLTTKPPKQADLMAQSVLSKFQSSAGKYVPPSLRGSNVDTSTVAGRNRAIVGFENLSISKQKNDQSTKNNKTGKNQQAKA